MHIYPAPLEYVPEDTVDVWSEFAAVEELHPLMRARLADLLWVRRHESSWPWVRVAIDAYVQVAAMSGMAMDERVRNIARAAEICRESPEHASPESDLMESIQAVSAQLDLEQAESNMQNRL